MPSRDQQQQIGKTQFCIDQPRAECMAFKMVDRDQRRVAGHGERLGADQPDHHPADETGAGGGGDRVAIGQRLTGIGEHALNDRGEPLGMRARGDLGDDAAIGRVLGILRGDPLGEDLAPGGHQRRCGFVAARFDAQYQAHGAFP